MALRGEGGMFHPLMGNCPVISPEASPGAFAGNCGEGEYRENHRHLLTEEYLKSVSSLSLSPGQVDEKRFLKRILLCDRAT